MSKDKTAKKDYFKAAMPRSADQCGMEEAFGLGLMNGPSPSLPDKAEKRPESVQLGRTDVPKVDC